jgi:hypothetical protein
MILSFTLSRLSCDISIAVTAFTPTEQKYILMPFRERFKKDLIGRAIAQVVSHWLPIMAAWVQS